MKIREVRKEIPVTLKLRNISEITQGLQLRNINKIIQKPIEQDEKISIIDTVEISEVQANSPTDDLIDKFTLKNVLKEF